MKKNFHRSFSIHTVLMLSFSSVLFIMITLVGTSVIFIAQKNMLNNSVDISQQLIAQAEFSLNNYFVHINSSLQNLVQDKSLVELCKSSGNETDPNRLKNREQVRQQILRILQNQTDIANILVLGDGFSVLHTDINKAPLMKSPLIQQLLEMLQTQEYATTDYHPISYPTYYDTSSTEFEIPISLMVRDYSTYDTTNYGVVLASLRMRTLDNFFAQMDSESGLTSFIVEKNGDIFYSSDSNWIGKTYQQYLDANGIVSQDDTLLSNSQGKNILLQNSRPMDINDWDIVLTTDLSQFNNQVLSIQYIVLTGAVLSLILSFFLTYFLIKRIASPIKHLSKQMEKINYERLSQKMSTRFSYKEIIQLYDGYNNMLDRIDVLLNEVYYEQLRQKEAQYEALQAKINPHFLYNTLQSISSLAILERNDDIEIVTNALGGMLEYLTYQKSSEVLLSQEIEYSKQYIQIQQLRYDNRFIAGYEIKHDTLSYRIGKLLLQPIVENAIKHGLEQKSSGGRLYIRTCIEDGLLIIQVEDNGAGMDETELSQLIERINNPDRNSSQKSIGLSNIQERIHLKYGTQYGLTIESIPEHGTAVKVRIPAVFSNSKED